MREVEALAGAVFQLLRVDVDVDDVGGAIPGNWAVLAAGVQARVAGLEPAFLTPIAVLAAGTHRLAPLVHDEQVLRVEVGRQRHGLQLKSFDPQPRPRLPGAGFQRRLAVGFGVIGVAHRAQDIRGQPVNAGKSWCYSPATYDIHRVRK